MQDKASFRTLLPHAVLAGVAFGAARASVWVYKSAGMTGAQYWGPALILLGLVVIMVALMGRVIVSASSINRQGERLPSQ